MGQQQNKSLKIIYTLVLALAYGLFIGVTIYTFYPFPEYPRTSYKDECVSQYDEDNYDYYDSSSYKNCVKNLDKEREKQQADYEQQTKNWFTIVSVILLVISTLTIAGSIFLNEKLEIISNGLLLGSFFTLLASDALSFGSGNKFITFSFSLIALLVTIATGYIKLVVKKKPVEDTPMYTSPVPVNYQPINVPPQDQYQQPVATPPLNQPPDAPIPAEQADVYVAPTLPTENNTVDNASENTAPTDTPDQNSTIN